MLARRGSAAPDVVRRAVAEVRRLAQHLQGGVVALDLVEGGRVGGRVVDDHDVAGADRSGEERVDRGDEDRLRLVRDDDGRDVGDVRVGGRHRP